MLISPFTQSPVRFVRELISLRRHGQEFDSTPMGRILEGRRLLASEL